MAAKIIRMPAAIRVRDLMMWPTRPDQEAEPQQHEEEGRRDPEVAGLARAVVREELRHHGDQGGEHGGESILRSG